jgi:hypothetical protein
MRLLDPVIKLVRDKVLGPRLRTYGESREELGGMPWQKFTSTERWFLPSARNLPPPVPQTGSTGAITLDTGAIIIAKPGLGDFLKKRVAWVIGGVAVMLVALVAGLASGGSKPEVAAAIAPAAQPAPQATAPQPAPAPVAVAPAPAQPVAAPVVTATAPAPVVAPHARSSKMSASVRALLAGKSTRGVARPTRLKKVHRR